MDEFKGNSNASKMVDKDSPSRSDKNIAPVTNNVTVKKETEVGKLRKKLFSEDAKSVGAHVVDSVVIPSLQKLITDFVKTGIDWFVYGSRGTSSNSSGIRNISYQNYYNRTSQPQPLALPKPGIYAVNDIIFNDRGEAEETLLRLREIIDRYGMVSVGEFYELICQPSKFTDQKYGWRDLNSAQVVRTSNGGYSIRFPKVTPLE